jgi:periplasmic protein TonB
MNIKAVLIMLIALFCSSAAMPEPVKDLLEDKNDSSSSTTVPGMSPAILEYPEEEKRLKIKGETFLIVTVNLCTGQLMNVAVEKSSRNRNLDRAAIAAVRSSTFSPTMQPDDPLRCIKAFSLSFVFD